MLGRSLRVHARPLLEVRLPCSHFVAALRPAPRRMRPCLYVENNAPVTLTNVEFDNCMQNAITMIDTNVTMMGGRYPGVLLKPIYTPITLPGGSIKNTTMSSSSAVYIQYDAKGVLGGGVVALNDINITGNVHGDRRLGYLRWLQHRMFSDTHTPLALTCPSPHPSNSCIPLPGQPHER